MRCLHINIRKASLIILSLLLNGVKHTNMADNHMDLTTKSDTEQFKRIEVISNKEPILMSCPVNAICEELNPPCVECVMNYTCIYGHKYIANCDVKQIVQCNGERSFKKEYTCRYCYQTDVWEHKCDLRANCNSIATSRSPYTTNCTVVEDVLCLGNRIFNKNILCNWTGGYRWSTALILSITLGGFGADRFYLGHWQEGIGKLFSFGGLGVWTLIDVILISLHYLGPADGSLYI